MCYFPMTFVTVRLGGQASGSGHMANTVTLSLSEDMTLSK